MPVRLPPLNSLKAFESAARNLSVKRAAIELNVTSAAVSHQIVLTKADKGKASELTDVTAQTVAEARTHPAAYPDIIAPSSEKGMGIAELRAAVISASRSAVNGVSSDGFHTTESPHTNASCLCHAPSGAPS